MSETTQDPFWLAVHFNEPTRILYAEPDQPAWLEAGWTVTGPHVPIELLHEAERELRVFQSALTDALRAHNVPAMPSWAEAIHWLARNGADASRETEGTK